MRNALRASALGAAVLVVLLGLSAPATADTVTTKTGQTLTVVVGGGLAGGRAAAQGTATISAGPTTIDTVQVSFDGHEEISVGVDAQGHFEVDTPWPADATSVTIKAIVTASDGTTITATHEGTVEKPARTRPHHRAHPRTLAPTGATDPPVLGPIGLVLVTAGVFLVRWSRRDEDSAAA